MNDLVQVEEQSKLQKRTNSKTLLIILVLSAAVILGILGYLQYQKGVLYEQAVAYHTEGNYKEAIPIFEKLKDYENSQELYVEATYKDAVQELDNGNYQDAILTFEKLGEYEDAESYLKQARLMQKYSMFTNMYYDWGGWVGNTESMETAENILADVLYGKWYKETTNEELTIDYYTITENVYLLKEGYCDGVTNEIWFKVAFLNETTEDTTIEIWYEYFNYIGEAIKYLSIGDGYYMSVTDEEYKELCRQEEEAYARQQWYSDNDIITKTADLLKSKVGSRYSGADRLYHNVTYSDAYVEYDWKTRTYTCTMIGIYNTNVFDFFGTSKQTYHVTAMYKHTDSGLAVLQFSAY